MKKLKKLLVAILSMAMVLSAGCFTPGGLTLREIVLDNSSVDREYVLGDTYDFSGIKLTAKYNDSTENKTIGYDDVEMTYDTEFNTKLGTHTITVKYTDREINQSKETTFNVTVVSSAAPGDTTTLNSITLVDSSVVKTYEVGDTHDFSGISLNAVYSDTSLNKTIGYADVDLSYNENFTSTPGTYTITVSYTDDTLNQTKSTTFTVTVEAEDIVIIQSITLIDTSIVLEYTVGDTHDFSGISLYVEYSDSAYNKNIGYSDITLTYNDEFTSTAGTYIVTVSYTDSQLGTNGETSFEVSVAEAPIVNMEVSDFIKPSAYTNYLSRATADRLAYGQAGYEGQLSLKNTTYKVGDDNAFKFVTKLWAYETEEDDTPVEQTNFSIEATIYQDDILLVAGTIGTDNKVSYTRPGESTVLVTVDVVRQEYQFSAEAVNQKFTIKVIPSSTYYYFAVNPIVQEITVNVVDGYNVYDPIQLALIDNTAVAQPSHENASAWATIKSANGLTDVNPKAIILQNDLQIKAEHIPDAFLGTLQEDFFYYDTVIAEGDTTYSRLDATPAGTKYIKDFTNIYYRVIAENDTFAIEGNSYSIDLSKAPLTPSGEIASKIKDSNGQILNDYGSDFSNVSMMYITTPEVNGEKTVGGTMSISNLDLSGNAERSQIVDKEGGDLRGAGGMIFIKSNRLQTNVYNVAMRNFFIGFLPDEIGGSMTVDYVKGFDFFQNAFFLWGGNATVSNSTFERCGGPLAIVQNVHPDTDNWISTISFANCNLKSELNGQEFWFSTVGANQMAGLITLLSQILTLNGMGSYTNSANKMNLIVLIMEDGSDTSVVANYAVQGKATIASGDPDDTPFVLSRMYSDATDVIAQYTKTIQDQLQTLGGGQIVPLFSVNEMFAFLHDQNNAGLTMVTGNDQLPMIQFNPASELTGPSAQYVDALKGAFTATDYYGLNYGGFGIVLGGYNA